MKKKLYRFRSIDNLIGAFDELNLQSIYFASPEQLNDPMEGYRDIFWKGDLIVWENFFRHYIFCLERVVSLYNIAGEEGEINNTHIPVFSGIEDLPTEEYKKLIHRIAKKFLELSSIKKLVAFLSENNTPIRREELYFYLSVVNIPAINLIYECYIEEKLTPETNNFNLDSNGLIEKVFSPGFYESVNDIDSSVRDRFFIYQRSISEQVKILNIHTNTIDSEKKNKNFIFLNFPQEYLEQIEKIMFPDWYTACFMTECNNSSVWGHYGDNHKGCCLVFELEDDDFSFPLRGINGLNNNGYTYGVINHKLHQIKYIKGYESIDFFKMLGNLRTPILNEMWLTNKSGQISESANEINGKRDEWRKNYWDYFVRDITSKSDDWSYENEYRIVLQSFISDFSDQKNRIQNYQFSSLKGIIFGIKTSIEDKLKIMKIIEKKCSENNTFDFKFYQSYYSFESGRIETYDLGLIRNSNKTLQNPD
ncbi:TPA: DUF2971 domain-containing protein [Serratia marcescens]